MKLFISGLVGGIILFMWGNISWMVLPWHGSTFQGLKNEKVVISTLSEGPSGVYLIPDLKKKGEDCCKYKGPSALIVWNKEGFDMGKKMLFALLGNIFCALLAAYLLSISTIKEFKKQMLFFIGLGLFAGLAVTLPNMIWWSFPLDHTMVGMTDLLIGSALSGAAISKIMK